MIKYALKCANDHDFESWFANSTSFDQQVARSQVVCPICATTSVGKAIMAPALGQGDHAPLRRPAAAGDALRALRDYVVSVTEDVGLRFPDEARKIAGGLSEHRAIRGEATREDARALLDEGIAILPLPLMPEDLN